MNKRKILNLLIFFIMLSFICTNKTGAVYNGSGGTSYNGGGVGSCTNLQNCLYNNKNMLIIQARLYYIKNGSFQHIGKTYYFVNTTAYDYLKNKGLNLIKLTEFDNNKYTGSEKFSKASNYLKEYFGGANGKQQTENAKKFLRLVTGEQKYENVLTKESKPSPNSLGYRIIIEPTYNYANPSFSNDTHALITVKGLAAEIATRGKRTSCLGNPGKLTTACANSLLGKDSQAQNLFTTFADVGISKTSRDYCENVTALQLADLKNGCGYNIIDVHQYSQTKKCYSEEIKLNGNPVTNLECVNYDENNVGKYETVYTKETSCDSTEDTENGKFIKKSGTCSIYCKESAVASLPGNVLKPQHKGSYFAWPTSPDTLNGLYNMSLENKLTCKIINTGGNVEEIAATLTRFCQNDYIEYNLDKCREISSVQKTCPEDYPEKNGICTKTVDPYCNSPYKLAKSVIGKGSSKKVCITCPEGYEQSSENSTLCKSVPQEKICKEDYATGNDGKCYKLSNATITETIKIETSAKTKNNYSCPSGYNPKKGDPSKCETWGCESGYNPHQMGHGGTKCRKPKYKYDGGAVSCDVRGGVRVDKSQCADGAFAYCCKIQDGYDFKDLIKYTIDANVTKSCPDYYTDTGKNGNQACEKITTLSCAGKKVGDICYTCPEGTTNYDKDIKKCISKTATAESTSKRCKNEHEEIDGKCYIITGPASTIDANTTVTTSKRCKDGYVEIGGVCYKLHDKTGYKYSCPSNYTKIETSSGTICRGTCNIDSLITSAKSVLGDGKMNAKLTVNSKNVTLKTVGGVSEYNDAKLIFTKKTYFKMDEYTNRYFNKIDGAVKSNKSGWLENSVFDRNQGVVTILKNDVILEKSKSKKYPLKLGIDLGTNNKFGKTITNYTCYYTITENETDCLCPEGTKNAGDSVSELIKQNCVNASISNTTTCLEWQNKICDYDPSKKSSNESCPPNRFYCKKNNANVDITDCVKSKMKTNTLQSSITSCNMEMCSINSCYSYTEKKTVSIEECLEDGISKYSCMKKYGCLGEKCTGDCSTNTYKTNNIVYETKRCNGKYCGFEAYCNETTKKTSLQTEICIKEQLNTNDILDSLNNGMTVGELETAIRNCKEQICASNEKILFRIIDLENPFPGNDNASNKSNFSLKGTRGRLPGYNWNGQNVVKKEILKARGVEGKKLYSKQPLLTITLTPSDIRKIRDYNKNNSYNNFNLNCSNEENTAGCISNFLHSSTSYINGGLKIGGIQKCRQLNGSSKLEDFNACYNSNN